MIRWTYPCQSMVSPFFVCPNHGVDSEWIVCIGQDPLARSNSQIAIDRESFLLLDLTPSPMQLRRFAQGPAIPILP
jgi:hypothetical protein